MGWLQLLFLIIRLAPEFISLIKEIIDAFQGGKKFSPEDFQDVKRAARLKRETGDSGPLREALERLRNRTSKP